MHNPMYITSLEEAQAALKNGAAVLQNAPGSSAYLGYGYVHALFQAVTAEANGQAVEYIFDAGDNPAMAIEALKQGYQTVVFTGEDALAAPLNALAVQQKACLITEH
ncbi:MAG: hypothetical protein KDD76_00820 [Rickettsiales bacterium]|nr:hypothetical protein [Rickettsiales bacterium]